MFRLETGLGHGRLHCEETLGRGHDLNGSVCLHHDVIGPGLERRFHNFVFAGARRVVQYTDFLEQIGHGTVSPQVTAVFAQGVAHFAHGAGAVVRGALHHQGHAAWAIAFVAYLFVVNTLELAGAAFNGALDGILGHVLIQGLVDGGAQARVVRRIATAAHARGHGDLAYKFGEDFPAFDVLHTLAETDIGPFTVSSHGETSSIAW